MKCFVALAAVATASLSKAVILEFDPWVNVGQFTGPNQPYFESGFEMFSGTGMEGDAIGAWQIAIRPMGFGDTITLKTQNNARFGIIHFPVVAMIQTDSITATGYLAVSGTVTSTFTGSGLWNLNWGLTYATGLSKIEFAFSPGPANYIDHLEVFDYPVPEPLTALPLGLGILWLISRKRSNP